ncbi:hypothetical protein [Streptomyces sp. INR7]|uniref:hypothetical protein n=1 Tax=Streptomyces sp. INR7 TaxID=2607753 RepID=UPI001629631E|nr:hypothetical protein [Streptomyces sp. INR7]QNE24120.1 hypothetical protein F1D59_04405 [Streptomyces sp. INR7]
MVLVHPDRVAILGRPEGRPPPEPLAQMTDSMLRSSVVPKDDHHIPAARQAAALAKLRSSAVPKDDRHGAAVEPDDVAILAPKYNLPRGDRPRRLR